MTKRIIILSLFLSLCLVWAVQASEISDMFREHKYQQVIAYFAALPDYQQNEESLYYLALSYSKLKKYEKAKETVIALYRRDPSFYDYRMQFDLEFDELFEQTDLKKELAQYTKGDVLAKEIITGQRLVKTSQGLYLYRNGVRLKLANDVPVLQAKFLNNDLFYVQTHELMLFSAKKKQLLKALKLDGGDARVWVDRVGRVNVQMKSENIIIDVN
ncbi:MAG: hypothetical protein ABII18_11865 [bacterium]|nr:hypothetical protein [bacterium]MBU1917893.1 hypothetical protein [bacterium]